MRFEPADRVALVATMLESEFPGLSPGISGSYIVKMGNRKRRGSFVCEYVFYCFQAMGEPTTTLDKRVEYLPFNAVSSILRRSRGNAKERREKRSDTHQLGWRAFVIQKIQRYAHDDASGARNLRLQHPPRLPAPSPARGWEEGRKPHLGGLGCLQSVPSRAGSGDDGGSIPRPW